MTATIYSHHFKVHRLSPKARELCREFSKRFLAWKFRSVRGRPEKYIDRVYAASNRSREYFRFHINTLESFKQFLRDHLIMDNVIEWILVPEYEAVKTDFKIKPEWKAQSVQEPHIEYLSAKLPVSKLLSLQTGKGKTFCALKACANIGLRLGVFIKAMYLDKWMADIKKTYGIDSKRICVIQGIKSLNNLFEMAKDGELPYDVIIFSISTVQSWIDEYENCGERMLEDGYSAVPENWMEKLGIGIKLVDETHQFFHAMFKLELYTHVPYSISLSATLVTKDSFLEKMHTLMFPLKDRTKTEPLHRYTHAYATHFTFKKPEFIRTSEYGSNMYSQNAVEESILKHVGTTENYMRVIDDVVKGSYIKNPLPGKRAAIFAYSIEMCTRIVEYLKKKHPDLDIRRYVTTDPYENAIDADIRVTTIGSMGTGIDIPNLVTVILTNALSSLQANIQVLGRLRDIPGQRTEFHFFTADNIPSHVKYYAEKRDLMVERAASFMDYNAEVQV